MAEAFAWGTLAASSLVIGALIAVRAPMRTRTTGLIMGFGSGVLISAVAFDLIEEAANTHGVTGWHIVVGVFLGCGTFYVGNVLIDRMGGADRKKAHQAESGSALAIVLGTVLDGVPESMVIGLTLLQGGAVSASYIAAVFISNLPEAISSSSGLVAAGWKKSHVVLMWAGIAVISGLAALVGYGIFEHTSASSSAFVLAFAAGAILTMLADTMMPEAYRYGGKLVGVVTTLGFMTAFALHELA